MSTKIFAIRSKETKEFISCNGHAAFSSAGKAKQSWNRYLGPFAASERFLENSNEVELIELTEIVYMYEDLCK